MGPQFDKSFEERCLCQFGGLNKSCPVEMTIIADNLSLTPCVTETIIIKAGFLKDVKRIASPRSMHDTECSGLVSWDDPEGWYREGGGRGVQDWERVHLWRIHVDVWQNQYNIEE